MFESRKFEVDSAGACDAVDKWLNGLREQGYGVKIANSVVYGTRVMITATKWKLGIPNAKTEGFPRPGIIMPTVIDERIDEPSIDYDLDQQTA